MRVENYHHTSCMVIYTVSTSYYKVQYARLVDSTSLLKSQLMIQIMPPCAFEDGKKNA